MDEIVKYLEESIADDVFSKSERKSLKVLIAEHQVDRDQLNFLRSKVYEIAVAKVTASNYTFILEWMRSALNALLPPSTEAGSEVFFSPGDECRNAIIRTIGSAVKRIELCVFTISDDTISQAILLAHQKGIPVRIITDNDKSRDAGSDIERFVLEGIPVRMDRTPDHMHHKFMVVDDNRVITGSYNWTRGAAQYNHENILMTTEPKIVKSYLKEFNALWSQMELVVT